MEEKSLHFVAGAEFEILQRSIWVWCFTDKYPGAIDVDCSHISPNLPVKIGDIEKLLPYGMYLHKMYNHQKFHSCFKLTLTNKYTGRQNLIFEQNEKIKD